MFERLSNTSFSWVIAQSLGKLRVHGHILKSLKLPVHVGVVALLLATMGTLAGRIIWEDVSD